MVFCLVAMTMNQALFCTKKWLLYSSRAFVKSIDLIKTISNNFNLVSSSLNIKKS